MLVITRRTGERFRIGDDVYVTVLSCTGHRVRIGVEAPPEVKVVREELYAPKNQVHSPATTGGLIPHQWDHILQENAGLKKRIAELERHISEEIQEEQER